MARVAFTTKKTLFTSKLDLNLGKKIVISYIWKTALYDKKTWKLWEVNQKYMQSFEMWCWRRMEISWTDHVTNIRESRRDKIKRKKANFIGHILHSNCLLIPNTEGKKVEGIEVAGGHKQLLDSLKKMRILEIETGRTRSHSVENSL
jgi:hypothetical protein